MPWRSRASRRRQQFREKRIDALAALTALFAAMQGFGTALGISPRIPTRMFFRRLLPDTRREIIARAKQRSRLVFGKRAHIIAFLRPIPTAPRIRRTTSSSLPLRRGRLSDLDFHPLNIVVVLLLHPVEQVARVDTCQYRPARHIHHDPLPASADEMLLQVEGAA